MSFPKTIGSSPVGFAARSLRQDLAVMRLGLPVRDKARLVSSKYAALAGLAVGRTTNLSVGRAQLQMSNSFSTGLVVFNVVNQVKDLGNLDMPATPTIVDVGANIGQFCSAALMMWPRSRILSIEADPQVAKQLAHNVGSLPGVTTLGIGVGREESELPFYAREYSVMSSFRRGEDVDPSAATMVPVVPLDSLTSGMSHIDLLKIDVEGFEYEVIEGGTETLRRSRWLWLEASLVGPHAVMELLERIHTHVPAANLTRVGRTYSPAGEPACVDLLVELAP